MFTAKMFKLQGREYVNPVDYNHPCQSLALRYDANRTRHAYYRHLRLVHEYFSMDPAELSESQLPDDFLFVLLSL